MRTVKLNNKTEIEFDDFAPPQNLEDLRFRLQIYTDELSNMREWISEEFGEPLNKNAIRQLEKAKLELEKLLKAEKK